MKLTAKQRLQLYEWAARLMRLPEINERAAKFDPPFQVDYLQIRWARKRTGVKFRQDQAKAGERATMEALARRKSDLTEEEVEWLRGLLREAEEALAQRRSSKGL